MIQSVLVSERPDASLRRRRVAEEYTPLHKACKVSHPSSLPPSLSSFFSFFSPSHTCSLHPPKSPLPTTILSFSATLHTPPPPPPPTSVGWQCGCTVGHAQWSRPVGSGGAHLGSHALHPSLPCLHERPLSGQSKRFGVCSYICLHIAHTTNGISTQFAFTFNMNPFMHSCTNTVNSFIPSVVLF